MQNPDAPEKLLSKDVNWKVCYGEIVEEDPAAAGMPTPLGQPVKIRTFLDADLADNVVTRRSHTGIFFNNSLIVQYSKKQNTVESATFGAEMVAIRVARDLTVALRIKLKMFGVPSTGQLTSFVIMTAW